MFVYASQTLLEKNLRLVQMVSCDHGICPPALSWSLTSSRPPTAQMAHYVLSESQQVSRGALG